MRTLTWPDSRPPLDLPGFETHARRLRYEALGDACRKVNIKFLLLAHHDDDQTETVLMRLATGHKGLGLKGMAPITDIPECSGMHGVHRSGQRDMTVSRLHREEEKDPSSIHAQRLRQILPKPDIFERGGVQIMRPLLNFSKERLVATCRARALLWEEDHTNKDAWRTPRNNIRALQRSDKLPQALRKPSMLQLAKKIDDNFAKMYGFALKVTTFCEILLLDVRCGGLIVRFPSRSKPRQDLIQRQLPLMATLLLQRMARIVSPQEEISLHSLRQASASIFPKLNDEHTEADTRLQPTTFTGGGVQFQRLHWPSSEPGPEKDPVSLDRWEDPDPNFVWKLTRQPVLRAQVSFTVQSSAHTESQIADNPPSWSPWRLWDGRYWIRVLNRSSRPLIIRFFQPPDLHYLRSTLSRQRYKELHRFLHLVVPGKVRWTLLAVAELGDDSLPMGRLLALPTLGPAGTFDTRDSIEANRVEWQVRYKRISLGYNRSDYGSGDGAGIIARNRNLVTSWLD